MFDTVRRQTADEILKFVTVKIRENWGNPDVVRALRDVETKIKEVRDDSDESRSNELSV